jgi:UDP-N-acetylmuramate--alanine ligase
LGFGFLVFGSRFQFQVFRSSFSPWWNEERANENQTKNQEPRTKNPKPKTQNEQGSAKKDLLGRTRKIHFVGVGGIGMSGIAELLANLGYEVTGSDARRSEVTDRLERLGVRVWAGHDADHVGDADVVVTSSAIRPGNPEVDEAQRRHVPVIPRAEMLAELMRLRYGIAIAGAHGKTTTTSMVALVLERAGLDPTAVIGGKLSAFGSNARLGRGEYMVVEADESDRSFLKLSPAIALITNLDREHMESYGSWENLQQAFVEFANKVPFYGAVVACADDQSVRELIPRLTRRVITYGLEGSAATVIGEHMQLEAFGSACDVVMSQPDSTAATRDRLRLQVPGRHNLLNALGAVAVGLEAGVAFERIAAALEEFRGADRRFQMRGEERGVMVVDDYGHHPTEIAAVIAAARAGIDRRVVVVFQPHRYSRTSQLLPEFGTALAAADEVVLTEIYAAGEDPIPGVTIDGVAEAVRAVGRCPVRVVKSLQELPSAVASLARSGDLVITLGAGSIGAVGDRILDELRGGTKREATPNGSRQSQTQSKKNEGEGRWG